MVACGDGGPAGPTRAGNNGGVSGQEGPSSLLGTWRSVVVIVVPGDLQTWTTTWSFDEAGNCRQTQEIESAVEGFPRVTERLCSYETGDFEVTITFVGGETLELTYSFADFSPDRLILNGFEYQRVS